MPLSGTELDGWTPVEAIVVDDGGRSNVWVAAKWIRIQEQKLMVRVAALPPDGGLQCP